LEKEMEILRGRVWKFGDNISTDLLAPASSAFDAFTTGDQVELCLSAERPEFGKEVRAGDLVVAGRNFGCGSSRPAAKSLITLGVSCVLAESIAAIFFRNSINLGLPALTVSGITRFFEEGHQGALNLGEGWIQNLSTDQRTTVEPMPPEIIRILQAGGLVPFLKIEAAGGRLYSQTVARSRIR
jgi:3-isopropylmalate/(R)-2-methylmalate dehydratase small subunit